MPNDEFYTFGEYIRKAQGCLSPSAEDYMEMIYRLSLDKGFTRTNDLASALNVQPPSVTKMVQRLAELKLIKYEKYGVIILEDAGNELGKVLLNRHNTIERFISFLNIKDDILEKTEKMEHTISEDVLKGIEELLKFFSDKPELLKEFDEYRRM